MKKYFIFGLIICSFAFAQGTESDKKIQQQLEENYQQIKTDILQLKSQAESATGVIKKDLLVQIENLEADQKKLGVKIKKLKVATGKAWGEIQKGASEAYDDLKSSFQKASDAYKELKSEANNVKGK